MILIFSLFATVKLILSPESNTIREYCPLLSALIYITLLPGRVVQIEEILFGFPALICNNHAIFALDAESEFTEADQLTFNDHDTDKLLVGLLVPMPIFPPDP